MPGSTTIIPTGSGSPVTAMINYGDSITVGFDATNQATTAYVPLLAAALGATKTNYAAGSSQTADQYQQSLKHTIASTSVLTYMIGTNDFEKYSNDTNKKAAFSLMYLGALAYLAIPDSDKILATDTGKVTEVGSWNPAVVDGAPLGRYSSTLNDTATFSITGSTILICTMMYYNQTSGGFTVKVDGVAKDPIDSPPPGNANITTFLSQDYGPNPVIISGLSDATHTVELKARGGNYSFWTWAAPLKTYATRVYVGNIIPRSAQGYANYGGNSTILAAYNTMISNNVTTLINAGLTNITLVDLNSAVNDTTDIDPTDGVHPVDSGHQKIATAFQNAMYTASSTGVVGTSGRPTTLNNLAIAASSSASVISLYDGTSASDTLVMKISVAANGNKRVKFGKGVRFKNGLYISASAAVNYIQAGYSQI